MTGGNCRGVATAFACLLSAAAALAYPSGGFAYEEYNGFAENGSRVFFSSSRPMATGASGDTFYLYERSNGRTTLVSRGPGAASAGFLASSTSGERMLLANGSRVPRGEAPGGPYPQRVAHGDIYAYEDGQSELISTGPVDPGPCPRPFDRASCKVYFLDASQDARTVVFGIHRPLLPSDQDQSFDIYVRRPEGLFLLTGADPTYCSGEGIACPTAFKGLFGEDGSRIVLTTDAQASLADSDQETDIYRWEAGELHLVTDGTAKPAFFEGTSDDGREIFFSSSENLDDGEAYPPNNLYGISDNGAGLRRINGSPVREGDYYYSGAGFLKSSGSRVLFETEVPMVEDDDNEEKDLYLRDGQALELVSRDSQGHSFWGAEFHHADPGLNEVIVSSYFSLTPADTNQFWDLYRLDLSGSRSPELITGRSGSCINPDACRAYFLFASPDGSRVFFQSILGLDDNDRDQGGEDIYLYEDGEHTLVSDADPPGEDARNPARWEEATETGTRVFYEFRSHVYEWRYGRTSRQVDIDEQPPDTVIVRGPRGETKDRTPFFYFGSDEIPDQDYGDPNTFECRLDDERRFEFCTGILYEGYTLPRLSLGPHTLSVRAVDAYGNTDPTPVSRSFRVVRK